MLKEVNQSISRHVSAGCQYKLSHDTVDKNALHYLKTSTNSMSKLLAAAEKSSVSPQKLAEIVLKCTKQRNLSGRGSFLDAQQPQTSDLIIAPGTIHSV